MAEWTKEETSKEAAKADFAKSGKYGRKTKRGPGRPQKSEEVTPKPLVGAAKRGPGRPKGTGKRGPGRPKGSSKGPGRPKEKRGRPKGSTSKTVSLKGYVKQREAKRMVKEALKAFKNKLPRLITKELKKLLR